MRAEVPLKPGAHLLETRFSYDGGGLGQGGDSTLQVDGDEVGAGRLERTIPFFFSMDQALNVGIDRGTPVTSEYAREGGRGFPFTGTLVDVRLEVGDDALQPASQDLLQVAPVAH